MITTIPNHPPKSRLPAARRLEIARGVVGRYAPFFGSVIYNLPMVQANERFKTMATDGNAIYYNEAYVAGLEAPELCFECVHETGHVILGHMWRFRGLIRPIANMAADLVLDEMLVDSLPKGQFKLPEWVKLDRALTARGGRTMEGVYKILVERNADASEYRGEDVIEAKDQARGSAMEARNRVMVAQALRQQKNSDAGPLSAGLNLAIQDILHPRLPWQTILLRYMTRLAAAKRRRTWSRLSRRSHVLGIPLPHVDRSTFIGLGPVCIAPDCSGSVTEEIRNVFQGECNGIFAQCRPKHTDVIYFDADVTKHDVFSFGQPIKLAPKGGGGTRFSPVIKAASELEKQPEVLIVLTDLHCTDYGPPPPFPVLWIVHGRNAGEKLKVPFGEIVMMPEFEKR